MGPQKPAFRLAIANDDAVVLAGAASFLADPTRFRCATEFGFGEARWDQARASSTTLRTSAANPSAPMVRHNCGS
ncbi:hypothetical protein NPS01_28540 [Nocardioides psychrotolerans]|uniref:Uncharacterized protein n=1 Tax=Nocardioides psychrotolerans TaxID=1005945 RepID=A0A1I3EQV1_9ACTN|nr:hypothetical protein NPS01_28540 [Nocardioides psychrotolerans]SFI01365.1 hypothetical protein SAMN05216561_10418 [Nocardioides psychrotolerans]